MSQFAKYLRGYNHVHPSTSNFEGVARDEAYLHAKFHLDPSNCLATVLERYRQTDKQTDNGLIA